jgi:hypothetical protein
MRARVVIDSGAAAYYADADALIADLADRINSSGKGDSASDPATVYIRGIEISNDAGTGNWGAVCTALASSSKYMRLDISGCTAVGNTITGSGDSSVPNAMNGFKANTRVTELVLPSTLESIGDYALLNCAYLTSVTIPSGVVSIGNDAFEWCTGLSSIDIPDSVTDISGTNVFKDTVLTSFHIPSGVTVISDTALSQCSRLAEITVDPANQYYSAADGVLYNKTKTRLEQYPHGKTDTEFAIPSTVTEIAPYAFHLTTLNSVSIPSGVTSIGEYAFYYGAGLTSAPIPSGVTSIGAGAFYKCALTSVTIPASVASIGANAFDYTALARVTFEADGVTIGGSAFPVGDVLTTAYIAGGAGTYLTSDSGTTWTKAALLSIDEGEAAYYATADALIADLAVKIGAYTGGKGASAADPLPFVIRDINIMDSAHNYWDDINTKVLGVRSM